MNDAYNHHFRRCIPWAYDEYMLVDGMEVVYSRRTPDDGGPVQLVVHLPGGINTTVEALREQGRTVVMPSNMRMKQTVA